MKDDVRRVIYITIIGFFLVLISWFSLIFVSSCGFTLTCNQAAPLVIRTSIPTLIPVSHPQSTGVPTSSISSDACQVSATDLIGAWVTAGSPETDAFPFTDVNGNPCEGTFEADIHHLFMDNSFWYTGAIGCTSCHNADLTDRSGGLDLSSYQGIIAGAQGKDILGGGNWDSSLLHDILLVHGLVPAGHSDDVPPVNPIYIYAGHQVSEASVTPTATP